MKVIESSGATREEAIQSGLKELGVDLHEVDRIDVIDEGSKGFLGLGKRPVRVRLSLQHVPSRQPQQSPGRRESGQDRRPPRQQQQQQQDRPNRGEGRSQDRGEGRSQDRGEKRDQGRRGKRKPGGPRDAAQPQERREGGSRDGAQPQERREGEGRGGGRRGRGGDRNRNRNRPPRDNEQGATGERQKPAVATHKASPITGKSPSNVSEEALEAQNLAQQFDTIDEQISPNYQDDSLPPDAREEEVLEPITDEQGREAAALLNEIIASMDLTATVTFARSKENDARLVIETEEDGGILIGKRGVTLEALQYLINRMIPQNGGNDNTERIVVDVGGYVDRRHAMLRDMALSMAKRAKDSRRSVRLKPLSPQERRIIHLTLEKDPSVRTFSTGDSLFRSIVINPVGGRRAGNAQRGPAPDREPEKEMDAAQLGD